MKKFDEKDIEKICNGDPDTIKRLFIEYYSRLVDFVMYMMGDLDMAENCVQDVFLNLLLRKKNISIESDIKVYLYSATKKNCLRYLRDLKIKQKYIVRNVEVKNVQETPKDEINQGEILQAIKEAIQDLPTKTRTVFSMKKLDGLTYSEIARVQGISIKTVETHMGRALKIMRKKLSYLR